MERIGVILIRESVTITDPCLNPRDWRGAVMNIPPGQWFCEAELVGDVFVKTLRISKPGYESRFIPSEKYCSVEVVSGQCGFFDTEYYEESRGGERGDSWYKSVCEICQTERCGLTQDSLGVVSASGYGRGDFCRGIYPVYIGRDPRHYSDIVTIEIRFS